jgi:hypothetical protein
MADFWNVDWLTRSPMFAPLRDVGARLPKIGWPDTAVLDAMADESGRRIVNANGVRIRFVEQRGKPRRFEERFEPSAFLRAEVPVRRFSWHDLFNALVWMTFPTAKAALNARHYQAMAAREGPVRSREEDALTLFDEEGMVVLSSDGELLELLRGFRWRELFWARRPAVIERMRFVLFGHALYEKALRPFVGMTGKALLFPVSQRVIALQNEALRKEIDRIAGLHLWGAANLRDGRAFSPLPVLGVPGWWPANETEDFYRNASYFRAGRVTRGRVTRDSEG